MAPGERTVNVFWATVSAFCAVLVGIGLLRFAYTPLIPALIADAWLTPSEAAYLGAANLAGYLAGAVLGRRVAAVVGVRVALRGMMLVAAASLFASAFPLSFLWFFLWRFLSGFSGAVLMVVANPTVLAHVPEARRGLVSGMIFGGIGVGIVLAALLVPRLLTLGLAATWLGIGGLALALAVLAWGGWPPAPVAPPPLHRHAVPQSRVPKRRALRALYLVYGLGAAGVVPHMVFLVDFIARGLGQGVAAGAGFWAVFGIGSMVGPVLAGAASDRLGPRLALRLLLPLQGAAVAALALTAAPVALWASTAIVGASLPGMVTLTLNRVRELVPADAEAQKAAWSVCTVSFALGQAVAAYGFSFLFTATGGAYALLFGVGAGILGLGLVADLWGQSGERGQNDRSGH